MQDAHYKDNITVDELERSIYRPKKDISPGTNASSQNYLK